MKKEVIETLEDAKGKAVRCTDGCIRMLEKYDDEFGYYAVPIGEDVWRSLSATNIRCINKVFIGGEVDKEYPTPREVITV